MHVQDQEERTMRIQGSCHCGNIRFTLLWAPQPERIPARACGCSFCTRHGGVWTSCPTGTLQVDVQDPDQVHEYTFATRTALFHVCRRCGVVPVVTSDLDGRLHAVVNVNTFEDVDPALLDRASVSFEGEDTGDRLARRRRNWIPDVVFAAP
jgi:hypothetical protein